MLTRRLKPARDECSAQAGSYIAKMTDSPAGPKGPALHCEGYGDAQAKACALHPRSLERSEHALGLEGYPPKPHACRIVDRIRNGREHRLEGCLAGAVVR